MHEPTPTKSKTTSATITVRLIRSFLGKSGNWKPFVIHQIDLHSLTTEQLIELIYASLPDSKLSPPFKTFKGYDTLKIESHAFGHKTNDPLINREDDDRLILKCGKTLGEQGVENETEISFFNMAEYKEYKTIKKPEGYN